MPITVASLRVDGADNEFVGVDDHDSVVVADSVVVVNIVVDTVVDHSTVIGAAVGGVENAMVDTVYDSKPSVDLYLGTCYSCDMVTDVLVAMLGLQE